MMENGRQCVTREAYLLTPLHAKPATIIRKQSTKLNLLEPAT